MPLDDPDFGEKATRPHQWKPKKKGGAVKHGICRYRKCGKKATELTIADPQ